MVNEARCVLIRLPRACGRDWSLVRLPVCVRKIWQARCRFCPRVEWSLGLCVGNVRGTPRICHFTTDRRTRLWTRLRRIIRSEMSRSSSPMRRCAAHRSWQPCGYPSHSFPPRLQLVDGQASPCRFALRWISRTPAIGPAGRASNSCGGHAVLMTGACTCCNLLASTSPPQAATPRQCVATAYPPKALPSTASRRGRCVWRV